MLVEDDQALREDLDSLLRHANDASTYFEGLLDAIILDKTAGPKIQSYIGQEISHYKILEFIGRGGMGLVFKARDKKLDRVVALKFLTRILSTNEQAKQQFIQEAKSASALDHTHIGTIYEINETDEGRLYIAMAYYEGEDPQKT